MSTESDPTYIELDDSPDAMSPLLEEAEQAEAERDEPAQRQPLSRKGAAHIPSDHVQRLRLLEALLFASAEPVAEQDLQVRFGDGVDIASLLAELAELYAHRGVNLVAFGGRWAFRTSPDLGDYLRMETEVQQKLSRAAIETLAIIAYHQPVTRAEIESIRGVATSKGTLDILMEAGWIRPGRRRETPGRPVTWITTPHFLDHFGLETLRDLPGVEDLRAAGLLDSRPAIGPLSGGASATPETPEED
ncbi:SMC-Scp complex subunit ScpB [Indioceanicola profundi]|uniref:SMC-Scp complex subunit ScpB n=1 Tax=Indioceanicola profundi TaxID=2220096 RepID=UPI001CEC23E0|nr:SMC-Scp complex subunit ScpB [Indioceanicola profundi]